MEVSQDFIDSCVEHNQLEYVNAFEEVIYEIIYRRELHNNTLCAVYMASKSFNVMSSNLVANIERYVPNK